MAHEGNKQEQSITWEHIQFVQSMIERCLQQYMTQSEVVVYLQQEQIDPSFTQLVWQKLEEQNPDFFKTYKLKLQLKEQITRFNYLVEQQVKIMRGVAKSLPIITQSNSSPQGPLSNELHSTNSEAKSQSTEQS